MPWQIRYQRSFIRLHLCPVTASSRERSAHAVESDGSAVVFRLSSGDDVLAVASYRRQRGYDADWGRAQPGRGPVRNPGHLPGTA